MDLYSMSYKMIQALAKENGIPANKKKKTLIKALEKLVLGEKIKKKEVEMPNLEPCPLQTSCTEENITIETTEIQKNERSEEKNSPTPSSPAKEKMEIESTNNSETSAVPNKQMNKDNMEIEEQGQNIIEDQIIAVSKKEKMETSPKRATSSEDEEKNDIISPNTSPKQNSNQTIKLNFTIEMEIDCRQILCQKIDFEQQIIKQIQQKLQYQKVVEDAFQAAKNLSGNNQSKQLEKHDHNSHYPRVKKHLLTPRKNLKEIHHETLKKIKKRRHSYCTSRLFQSKKRKVESAKFESLKLMRESWRERALAYAKETREKNKQRFSKKKQK